jgi:hypothetical protein
MADETQLVEELAVAIWHSRRSEVSGRRAGRRGALRAVEFQHLSQQTRWRYRKRARDMIELVERLRKEPRCAKSAPEVK